MRKKILIGIFFLSAIFLLTQISSADVQPEKCRACHGAVKPLVVLTKNCLVCHETHASPPGCCMPTIRVPEQVHKIHLTAGEGRPEKGGCRKCHQSPVGCTNCHNSHEIIGNTALDVSLCTNCHGALPQPTGHTDFRNALPNSKHRWMNCKTCHLFPSGNIELHFKDLSKVEINDSANLCRICHSLQYGEMKEGTHGASNKTCVDCHNPHTTSLSGPKFPKETPSLVGAVSALVGLGVPKETPPNISVVLDLSAAWITTKVPVLKNTTALFVMFLIITVTLSEYLLTKHDEDKKVAYNMVKIQADEKALKTLEINLKHQDMNLINKALQEHEIDVLGMTMTKEKNKDDPSASIYKYVIFIDAAKINEQDLINIFSSMNGVASVRFTDKYEL